MADSTSLKIDRAAKHIVELNEVLRKKRPFTYVVETDTNTHKRSVFRKADEAVVEECAVISGDAVHNLRCALDHVYWEIVAPCLSGNDNPRRVQFPFTQEANRFPEAARQGYAHRAGTGFYCAILKLKAYEEIGGNELLSLIYRLDIIDKHKLLIPTIDYKKMSSDLIKAQVSDFPLNFPAGGFRSVSQDERGTVVPPFTHKFQRKLNIPTDIIFTIWPSGQLTPVIPTLNAMVDMTRETISILRASARSY
jgi:hypothetical protein